MKHAMIDIETLGTRTDSKILQIGAVTFDPYSALETDAFAEQVLAKHADSVSIESQPTRSVTQGTLEFWSRQPLFPSIIAKSKDGFHLSAALENLRGFLLSEQPDRIWANGTTFDIGLLTHAYEEAGLTPYWGEKGRFRSIRCMRGLLETASKVLDVPTGDFFDAVTFSSWAQTNFVPHDALSDSIYQAKVVQTVYQRLGFKE